MPVAAYFFTLKEINEKDPVLGSFSFTFEY